MGLFDRSI